MSLMNSRLRPLIAGRNYSSVMCVENQFRNEPILCAHGDGRRLVLQTLTSFRMKLDPFEVLCVFSHGVLIFFAGNPLSPSVRHRPAAKQKHYGTTVPLQLVGQDWKPVGRLRSQVKRSC